jgi:hypothetical protein
VVVKEQAALAMSTSGNSHPHLKGKRTKSANQHDVRKWTFLGEIWTKNASLFAEYTLY